MHALPIKISMNHLRSSESTQIKSQNDRPSPEIPLESRVNLRVPVRFNDIEGGTICSKNSTFDYFDETVWTLRLRSSTPITAAV